MAGRVSSSILVIFALLNERTLLVHRLARDHTAKANPAHAHLEITPVEVSLAYISIELVMRATTGCNNNIYSKGKKMNMKMEFTRLLSSTKREGMDKLIDWLVKDGFFKSPASTRYHGCHDGGLADHSLRVFDLLFEHNGRLKLNEVSSPGQKPLEITKACITIVGLLHDVCKVGAYIPTPGEKNPYKWNKKQPKGHALLSIERIKKYIELTELEEMMIKYHMGVYGLNEFYGEDDWQTGEYPLRGDHSNDKEMSKEESKAARYGKSMANAWFHNPVVKVIYFCDELATLEEKAK